MEEHGWLITSLYFWRFIRRWDVSNPGWSSTDIRMPTPTKFWLNLGVQWDSRPRPPLHQVRKIKSKRVPSENLWTHRIPSFKIWRRSRFPRPSRIKLDVPFARSFGTRRPWGIIYFMVTIWKHQKLRRFLLDSRIQTRAQNKKLSSMREHPVRCAIEVLRYYFIPIHHYFTGYVIQFPFIHKNEILKIVKKCLLV